MNNKYLKYIYGLIIFYIVWLVGVPLGFRLAINPVLNQIKPYANIEMEKPRLITSVIPNIKFKADSIKLLNKDNSNALNITNFKINLRILPLIIGRLHLNYIGSDDFKLNLYVKEKLFLGDYEVTLPEKQMKTKIDKIKCNNIDLSINQKDNKISLLTEKLYFKNTKKSIVFKNNTRIIFADKVSNAKFNINFPHNKNLKKAKFDVNINDFELNPWSQLVSDLTKNEITSLDGIINLNSNNKNMNVKLDNLSILYKNPDYSIIFPKQLNINSVHELKGDGFNISKMEIKGENLFSTLSGEISEIISKNPKFDLKIIADIKDLRGGALMLPPLITPDINIPKLKRYPFYGKMTGDLKIKGYFPEPEIFGNIKVTDGIMINPIPNTTQGANINIDFKGKKCSLDVVVPAGGKEIVYVSGDITLYGESFANLKVRSSASVDLNVAENVLNPLHQILCFQIGPVPIMDIEGRGNVDIKIIGTKKDPHIWGDFNFKNTSAKFLDVNNLKLEHADGNLNFNDQKAHFINNTGVLHGQKATIEGVCTLFGDLDFNVTANNQNLNDLLITLVTSPMLEDIKQLVPPVKEVSGKSDFYLNLKGKLVDINDLKLNENVIPKGYIKLKGISANIMGLKSYNTNGIINYEKNNCDFNIQSTPYKSSQVSLIGFIKDNIADIKINAPKICVNTIDPKLFKVLDTLYVKLKAHYKGNINNIEIGAIDSDIEIIKDNIPVKNSKIYSGKIHLKNSNLKISNLKGTIKNNPFYLNLSAGNIGDKTLNLSKANINGDFNFKSFDISLINMVKSARILPSDIQSQLEKINFKEGYANIRAKAKNSKLDAIGDIANADFEYCVYENSKKEKVTIPIKLISGKIGVKNNLLTLNKMNCLVDNMPVLVFGQVSNIYNNPQYRIQLNSKFVQKVFDKYWNAYNIYPIKTNGDIVYSSLITGNKDHTKIHADIKMEENSYIYYMGATIGDSINPITVNIDADMNKSGWININKFKYNKLISSQNNKQNVLPLLSVNGQVKQIGKLFEFKNLAIKTDNPTNANVFNIIFKKPTIKQGNFTSNLVINGRSDKPKILGTFDVNNMEMPYLNTTINGLSVNFKPDNILVVSKGNFLENYIMVNASIKNHLIPPYRVNNADIYINDFDINKLMSQLKQLELKGLSSAISSDTDTFGAGLINSTLFNKVKLRAGTVRVQNIKASNLEAECSSNDKMNISVDNFKFNMASGAISGKINYNLLNNFMQMELSSKDVNANELVIALFDIPNQIYGSLTGHIELSCNATDDKTRLSTLSGFGTFNVTNGKMPKLGSLEYLLKAGNLIKGGITGLSMNGIIDIVTPMKTGEFSSIKGNIRIKDGVAKTVEINTNGKNLNLYMIGSVNLCNQIADMHVFGQLSKKASTILGAAGNISLNTLFNKIPGVSLDKNSPLINDINKIPGIELSNKSTRKFMVEILGDINGDDFVKSFKWIN